MNENFQFSYGRPFKEADEEDMALIEESIAYWRAQDVELTLSTYSEDVIYRLYTFQGEEPGFC